MSEIRATTISNRTGDGPVTLRDQKAAKAGWQYTQTGPTIDASFNTSSITDITTGEYDWVPTNNMADAFWIFGGCFQASTVTAADRGVHIGDDANKSASFGTFLAAANGTLFDDTTSGMVMGDLA